jgi:transposase
MHTTQTNPGVAQPAKRSWRRHSDEFKAHVVESALQPHVSMASVALANGINANMLRRWVREAMPAKLPKTGAGDNAAPLSFMQLPIEADQPIGATQPSAGVIDVQIQRGETKVMASLPLHNSSAAWLREVLA